MIENVAAKDMWWKLPDRDGNTVYLCAWGITSIDIDIWSDGELVTVHDGPISYTFKRCDAQPILDYFDSLIAKLEQLKKIADGMRES